MESPRDQYLRNRVLTASPGELLVMLYDALLRRVRAAGKALEEQDVAAAGEHLGRSQDILHELMRVIDPDPAPELAERLTALYGYCSRRLLEAIAQRDAAACHEVEELLAPLRDAWAEAHRETRQGEGGGALV